MGIPGHVLEAIGRFDSLGRWDRAELGRSLRRLGLSYGEIMELIPVPKGTLAGWCREIRLTEEQIAALKQRRGPRAGPRDTQWKRRLEVEQIRSDARVFALENLSDAFWVAGTVLYWGEGSKTTRRLEIANSDPRTLRLFITWTRRYIDPGASFAAALNLHRNNNELEARLTWQHELGLQPSDFTRSYIKPEGTGHRKNHLAHGVCRIRLRKGTNAFLTTMEWIDVLAEAWAAPHPQTLG